MSHVYCGPLPRGTARAPLHVGAGVAAKAAREYAEESWLSRQPYAVEKRLPPVPVLTSNEDAEFRRSVGY